MVDWAAAVALRDSRAASAIRMLRASSVEARGAVLGLDFFRFLWGGVNKN